MKPLKTVISRQFTRFHGDQSGAALVEFALILPIMLLMFAVIIEGARLMWSYQSVAAGVRDATRYLARVAPVDICTVGRSVTAYTSDLETIVRSGKSGYSIFPTGISVNSVTPSLTCVVGTYRVSPAPVVQVSASLTVTFPFVGIFSFNGESISTVTTTIRDQNRVFGS